jgi:amino acid permease
MPTMVPMSPGAVLRRNFFDRSFGKVEKGGIRNSMFLLCNAALGGGVLSLPYMFVLSGWLTGYILLMASAFAGMWSNLILAQLAIRHKKSNYNEIVLLAGGPKLQRALQGMLIVYLFGACCGY